MADTYFGAIERIGFQKSVDAGSFWRPVLMKIKPSSACNLRCTKCDAFHRCEPPLHIDLLRKTLTEASRLGARALRITGGEPLLYPHITELIDWAAKCSLDVSLTTNGTKLNLENCDAVLQAGARKFSISLDSHDPAIHDRLVGVSGAWEATTSGVRHLLRASKRFAKGTGTRAKIKLVAVLNRENIEGIHKYVDMCEEFGVRRVNLMMMEPKPKNSDIQLTQQQVAAFYNELPELKRYARDKRIAVQLDSFPANRWRRKCLLVHAYLFINYDGMVSVCCGGKPLGSLFESPLAKILEGDRTREYIRNAGTFTAHPMCRYCLEDSLNRSFAKLMR